MQARSTSPSRAGDARWRLDAPTRGGAGSRRCGWGGRCRREAVRVCMRTSVCRIKNIPVLALPGREITLMVAPRITAAKRR
jgi:hypothetical protein